MINWEQSGWAQREWGYQAYLHLEDPETGEVWDEAPGFDHKPTGDEVVAAAQKIIGRILQTRIEIPPQEPEDEKEG